MTVMELLDLVAYACMWAGVGVVVGQVLAATFWW